MRDILRWMLHWLSSPGAVLLDPPTVSAVIYGPNPDATVYGSNPNAIVYGPNPDATLGGG